MKIILMNPLYKTLAVSKLLKKTIEVLEEHTKEYANMIGIRGGDGDGSGEHHRGTITHEQYEEHYINRLAVREAYLTLRDLERGNGINLKKAGKNMSPDDEKERVHESYGMIALSRVHSSGDTPFFGSKLKCKDFISIRINTGSHKRGLNSDWYHADSQIIEVRLTPSQFAEFITGMNMGDGYPCTINNFMGRSMDLPPHYSKIEEFDDEFKNKMQVTSQSINELLEDVKSLEATGTISKGKREEIAARIRNVSQQLKSNMPYVAKCFSEHMEKTTSEFKQEAEAYLTGMISRAGIESLQRDNFPAITADTVEAIEVE